MLPFRPDRKARRWWKGRGPRRLPCSEIEFLAANPVNCGRRLQGFSRQHHRVRADKADLGRGSLGLDGLGHLAIVFQRRRGGVDDDVIEFLGNGERFHHADVVCGQSSSREFGVSAAGCASQWDTNSW